MWFTKVKRAQSTTDFETWIQGGVVPTLNAMDNNGEAFATVLIVGVDLYNADVSESAFKTVAACGGITSMPSVLIIDKKSGENVPMIFSHTQGLDIQASETNSPTLRTGGAGMAVVYPIDDGRELEKHQNGTGIGEEGAPAYTLDRQQLPAVALAFDLYNQQVTEKNQTLSSAASDASHTGTIWEGSIVRRLTPTECERLQGFPDNWTDGQADSNRYKQMGNAVAVPVVQWIIDRMVAND